MVRNTALGNAACSLLHMPVWPAQIHFLFLVSRQGKVRLTKWYDTVETKQKDTIMREVSTLVLNRPPRMSNFLEWGEQKLVYKR